MTASTSSVTGSQMPSICFVCFIPSRSITLIYHHAARWQETLFNDGKTSSDAMSVYLKLSDIRNVGCMSWPDDMLPASTHSTVASYTAQRYFSTTRCIKSYIRSLMSDSRLSNVALIAVERERQTRRLWNTDHVMGSVDATVFLCVWLAQKNITPGSWKIVLRYLQIIHNWRFSAQTSELRIRHEQLCRSTISSCEMPLVM